MFFFQSKFFGTTAPIATNLSNEIYNVRAKFIGALGMVTHGYSKREITLVRTKQLECNNQNKFNNIFHCSKMPLNFKHEGSNAHGARLLRPEFALWTVWNDEH